MKKLYRKSSVHPSPPPPSTDPLAFLPAAILTLAAALTAGDREVLAYLLSCSSVSCIPKQGRKMEDVKSAHAAAFNCDCFSCYTSYWARWDSSPNRQLIHEIIDAYESRTPAAKNNRGSTRRRKKAADGRDSPRVDRVADQGELGVPEPADDGGEAGGGEEEEKGSLKKLVGFIGERIWGFWG